MMGAPASAARDRGWLVVRIAVIAVVVVGLTIDAYVHFNLAGNYEVIKTSTLSQAQLFRAEGVVAIIAALLLVVRPRRYTAAFAALVAGSALLALLIYRYNDIGQIGPIPSMYEPIWFPKKTVSAFAEGAALLAAMLLVLLPPGRSVPTADHAQGQSGRSVA